MAIIWQDVITNLITTVGGGVVVLGAAAWLVRTVITAGLAREARVFEVKLKADTDAVIERLRSSLQIAAVEHQVRFSNLHEKRAQVIGDLYTRLVDALWDARRFLLQGSGATPERREEYAAAERKIHDLVLFIDRHRIYLPGDICTLLDKFVDVVRKPVIRVFVYGDIEHPNEQSLKARNEALMGAFEAFENDIPAAKRALESEFRAMLGGSDPTPSS